MDETERYEQGLAVRRSVLGDTHVDHALEGGNDLNREFQDFITRYAWGEIWSRPGLDRKQRSLITLAMLVALNRPEELEMHVGAAVRNGVTREEIKEVLLQAGIYCGLPAANAALRLAGKVFAAADAGPASPAQP